ncbi:MAG: hypothetical protein DCF15_00625 [Phormidesmis priestleyi]|uniref:Uncharacterized protein n=1 Tax=Phormidesmis priestleyi TaxID=268141 RepID=A0A2W4ZSL0_9CYAN|nr:MAG: hypothetical protein DCF15_00625 [Phormidesmis priestleyi]
MKWLKTSNLFFLAFSTVRTLQSIAFHADVLALPVTATTPNTTPFDIGLGIAMIFAIKNTHQFNEGSNWMLEISRLCPVWLKLYFCCVWIYGAVEGISHFGMPLWAENPDYWRFRESSVADIVLYSTTTVIFYASVKRDRLHNESQ